MRTVLAVAGGKYKHNNNHKNKYPQTCLSNIQPYASTKRRLTEFHDFLSFCNIFLIFFKQSYLLNTRVLLDKI